MDVWRRNTYYNLMEFQVYYISDHDNFFYVYQEEELDL